MRGDFQPPRHRVKPAQEEETRDFESCWNLVSDELAEGLSYVGFQLPSGNYLQPDLLVEGYDPPRVPALHNLAVNPEGVGNSRLVAVSSQYLGGCHSRTVIHIGAKCQLQNIP